MTRSHCFVLQHDFPIAFYPEKNQFHDLASLAPAESGYISVNIGARQGPTVRFTVILTTTDGLLVANELDIDISDKERIDQTGR